MIRSVTAIAWPAVACLLALPLAAPATARADETRQFDIAAQPLVAALKVFAEQANMQLLYKHEVVEGARANTVVGQFEKHAALKQLLQGTGLQVVFTSDDVAAIKAAAKAKARDSSPSQTSMVTPDSAELYRTASDAADDKSSSAGQPRGAVAYESAVVLDEVIVTAQRREERLRDVPMGITALTGDNLDKLQQTNFTDYAALVPGLSVTQTSLGQNLLTLRGLSANGAGSTVAVYVDDSPFGSSSALASGAQFAGNFDPWDMQRIEVLRGPQGMFYGASAEGGLIKFVTNAPVPGAFSSKVEVGGSNISDGSTGWSAKAMTNLPVGDLAALRLSAFTERAPGYIDDPLLATHNVNRSTKDGGRVGLLLTPTDNLTVRLTAFAQNLKLFGSPDVDIDRHTRQPVFGDFTQERTKPEPNRFEYRNYNATVTAGLGFANLTSSTSYNTSANHLFSDVTLQPAGPTTSNNGQFISQLIGQPAGVEQAQQSTTKKFTEELRLESVLEGAWEWQVGAFYTHESAVLFEPTLAFNPQNQALIETFLVVNLTSRYTEKAGFGSVTYHFNPQLDLQLGGRWTTNNQSAVEFQSAEAFGVPPTVLPSASSDNKFLYSVAPRWHVTDDLMVYARVASGFESGGPNPLPVGVPASIPLEFRPDSTVNYELGVRSLLLDKRVSVDVTAFRINWTDVQLNETIPVPGQTVASIIANGGRAKSQGVEWSIGYTPIRDLTFTWVGAYTDARLTTAAPAVGGMAGQQLPNSPQWSSSLNFEYGWSAFAHYRAFIGGIWAYTGPQYQDFHQDPDFTLPATRISGYTLGSLRAGLQNEQWGVTLNVNNITGKRALSSFVDSYYDHFPATGIYVQPRTILLSVSRSF